MISSRGLRWSLAALGLLVAAMIGSVILWALDYRDRTRAQLETIEPRYARMLGYAQERQAFRDAAASASAAIAAHVYPAGKDASQAGNDAQQRVRDLLVRGGLDVATIRLLPARPVEHFDRLGISVRAEGTLLALQSTLAALPMSAPTLFVEGFALQGVGISDPAAPARVVAEIEFFVLRGRP